MSAACVLIGSFMTDATLDKRSLSRIECEAVGAVMSQNIYGVRQFGEQIKSKAEDETMEGKKKAKDI